MKITLNKAVKRLENLAIHHRDPTYHDDENAIKLGIKALERIDGLRSAGHYIGMPLLKGETKE